MAKWRNEKGELIDMPLSPDALRQGLACIPTSPPPSGFKVTNLWVGSDGKLVVEYDDGSK